MTSSRFSLLYIEPGNIGIGAGSAVDCLAAGTALLFDDPLLRSKAASGALDNQLKGGPVHSHGDVLCGNWTRSLWQ